MYFTLFIYIIIYKKHCEVPAMQNGDTWKDSDLCNDTWNEL